MISKKWLPFVFSCFIVLLSVTPAFAQEATKYFTKEGHIAFYSSTPLEKIEAHNYQSTSVMDIETGKLEFAVLIKAFDFEKALMQEHFNENYMESDEYPKSVFKGAITNFEEVDFSKPGTYPVKVAGNLTIHGVTNEVASEGTLEVGKDGIVAASKFTIAVADYGIKIPSVVAENIAKEVDIVVDIEYKPFNR